MNNKYGIDDEIYDAYLKATEVVARDLGDQIETEYERVIAKFYQSYSQSSYVRGHHLRWASSGYKKKKHYYKKANAFGFIAGIYVDPGLIREEYKRDSKYPYITKEWIFNRAFSLGIHGFNSEDVAIHNKAAELTNEDLSKPKDKRHKLSGRFERMQIWDPNRVPTTMKTPPEKLLDKKFMSIGSSRNINSRMSTALRKNGIELSN